jgi:hypothetical protein
MLIPLPLVAPHSLARARVLSGSLSVLLARFRSPSVPHLGALPRMAKRESHTTLVKLDATFVRSTL